MEFNVVGFLTYKEYERLGTSVSGHKNQMRNIIDRLETQPLGHLATSQSYLHTIFTHCKL